MNTNTNENTLHYFMRLNKQTVNKMPQTNGFYGNTTRRNTTWKWNYIDQKFVVYVVRLHVYTLSKIWLCFMNWSCVFVYRLCAVVVFSFRFHLIWYRVPIQSLFVLMFIYFSTSADSSPRSFCSGIDWEFNYNGGQ